MTRLSPLGKGKALARQLAVRPRPLDAVFSSFGGQFSDNPRAVWEELVARGTGHRTTWVRSPGTPLPAGVAGVEPASSAYAAAVGRARLVVSNAAVQHYVKRRGVTYLQTWHGTPLKRIGFDNPRYGHDRVGMRRARRDYARWDLLVSQNAFSTEVFRRAFRYDGEVLEVGYPRNDLLLSPHREAVRESARVGLGLAGGVTAVLYAPTFRDDQEDQPGGSLALDLTRVRDALGESVHVLARLHHRDAQRLGAPSGPGWTDVSGAPDIRELYLAADVLVTDYSSTMFDFAVTGKPVVYLVHDLERYRDAVRGFYFDLEEQAPGPLCRTTDEVVDRLAALDDVVRDSAVAYERFRARYCYLDDGRASARVVDRLLRDA